MFYAIKREKLHAMQSLFRDFCLSNCLPLLGSLIIREFKACAPIILGVGDILMAGRIIKRQIIVH